MILTILLIIIFLTVFILFLNDLYSRESRLIQKIPGPSRWPFIGNSLHFVLPLDKLFTRLRSLPKKYGDVAQMHGLKAKMIGFYDPHNVEIIMSSINFSNKRIPYNFMKPWLGEGLLTSQGLKWHQRRKMLTQAFHFNTLKRYSITFKEEAEKFVQQFEKKIGNSEINIVPLVNAATLRTMCVTAMGVSTKRSLESVASKYSKAIEIVGATIVERMCRVWLHLDCIFKLSTIAKVQEHAIKEIHSFTNEIIKERRAYLQENNVNIFDEDSKIKGRLAMLDLLLEKEKSGAIDVNGIREEVDTFMFEGHDTTSTALSYLLMNIANETEIQEKIYKELITIFSDSQRMPTTEDLNDMKYLECCIKESLRLYPSVPIILRYLSDETIIGNYTVPRNSHVFISIYDLHRRPDIYPDPEKFVPERFLPKNCAKRHPYAYIPFSAGPRNCIGQKFAMLEMKTLVSTLLRRYRLDAVTKPADLVFKTDIILRTNNPMILVKFFKRN